KEYGEGLSGFRVAVQEYGTSNPDLLETLNDKALSVTKVPVYQWALPEDLQPLREAVLGLVSGGIDVVLFTTGVQVVHLFEVAGQMGAEEDLRAGLRSVVVASIGPTTTEVLHEYGVQPDFEPSHPKMGFLINEAAQLAGKMVDEKKSSRARSMSARQAGLRVAVARSAPKEVAVEEKAAAGSTAIAPIDFLHEITSRIASADSFHKVLGRIVDFVTTVIPCDSCFIYVLE
ncbi:MAG TPA: uroporphyrinogen-III synthase, partial [Edaphobacter sp.]|nr:uroporphyrinogen-III synthase [Edaphobacter sp.]